MTGFSRVQGQADTCTWQWEVKSVNGKGLDLRTRVPPGFDGLDQPLRERAAKRFHRGNFSLNLTIQRVAAAQAYAINADLLDQLVGMADQLRQRLPDAAPPRIDGLLGLRGVIEPVETEVSEDDRAKLESALLADLDQALAQLAEVRAAEGAKLFAVLTGQLDAIEALCKRAEALAGMQPEAIRAKLVAQITDLLGAVPALSEDRLAQEAAVLMTKADVREELDRLAAHLSAARDLLAQSGPVGRKLDFLCQEFTREANTLCSKSADTELTRIGLDLKATIEQFREQVQNIE